MASITPGLRRTAYSLSPSSFICHRCLQKPFTAERTIWSLPSRLSNQWFKSDAAIPTHAERPYPRTYQGLVQVGLNRQLMRSSSTVAISTFQTAERSSARAKFFPQRTHKVVGYWLLGSAASVFGIVVFGGLTRLTESGLSITEWKPVTGSLPPLSAEAWESEFRRYSASPEFKLLNPHMTLSEFKKIYFMEWTHRLWGRVIGLSFVLPALYFVARRRVSAQMSLRLLGISGLIGLQGIIGWWMVKSGLKDDLFAPGSHPRVSQYRLTAHLAAAFICYGIILRNGLSILLANKLNRNTRYWYNWSSKSAAFSRHRTITAIGALLVFITAMSGGLVAGLDAGLIYNEFPRMGTGFAPPVSELFSDFYSRQPGDIWWRNLLENPSTVQLQHRILATTTFTAIMASCAYGLFAPHSIGRVTSKIQRRGIMTVASLAILQVTLGISTLIYMIPVPLAAIHQAGSLALLTSLLYLDVKFHHIPKHSLYTQKQAISLFRTRKVEMISDLGTIPEQAASKMASPHSGVGARETPTSQPTGTLHQPRNNQNKFVNNTTRHFSTSFARPLPHMSTVNNGTQVQQSQSGPQLERATVNAAQLDGKLKKSYPTVKVLNRKSLDRNWEPRIEKSVPFPGQPPVEILDDQDHNSKPDFNVRKVEHTYIRTFEPSDGSPNPSVKNADSPKTLLDAEHRDKLSEDSKCPDHNTQPRLTFYNSRLLRNYLNTVPFIKKVGKDRPVQRPTARPQGTETVLGPSGTAVRRSNLRPHMSIIRGVSAYSTLARASEEGLGSNSQMSSSPKFIQDLKSEVVQTHSVAEPVPRFDVKKFPHGNESSPSSKATYGLESTVSQPEVKNKSKSKPKQKSVSFQKRPSPKQNKKKPSPHDPFKNLRPKEVHHAPSIRIRRVKISPAPPPPPPKRSERRTTRKWIGTVSNLSSSFSIRKHKAEPLLFRKYGAKKIRVDIESLRSPTPEDGKTKALERARSKVKAMPKIKYVIMGTPSSSDMVTPDPTQHSQPESFKVGCSLSALKVRPIFPTEWRVRHIISNTPTLPPPPPPSSSMIFTPISIDSPSSNPQPTRTSQINAKTRRVLYYNKMIVRSHRPSPFSAFPSIRPRLRKVHGRRIGFRKFRAHPIPTYVRRVDAPSFFTLRRPSGRKENNRGEMNGKNTEKMVKFYPSSRPMSGRRRRLRMRRVPVRLRKQKGLAKGNEVKRQLRAVGRKDGSGRGVRRLLRGLLRSEMQRREKARRHLVEFQAATARWRKEDM